MCRIGHFGAPNDSRGEPPVQAVDRLEHMVEVRVAQVGVDERYRSPSLGEHDSEVGCDSRFAVLRARAGHQHHRTLLINRCELQRRPEPAERLAFG